VYKLLAQPCVAPPAAAPGGGSGSSGSSGSNGSSSRPHAADTKTKLALTRFLRRLAALAALPPCRDRDQDAAGDAAAVARAAAVAAYLRPVAGVCAWHCLPLLCSHQVR